MCAEWLVVLAASKRVTQFANRSIFMISPAWSRTKRWSRSYKWNTQILTKHGRCAKNLPSTSRELVCGREVWVHRRREPFCLPYPAFPMGRPFGAQVLPRADSCDGLRYHKLSRHAELAATFFIKPARIVPDPRRRAKRVSMLVACAETARKDAVP